MYRSCSRDEAISGQIDAPAPAVTHDLMERPPLGLYIHLPWCVKKCPYCDFNSHALRGTLPERRYRDALLNDLAAENRWSRMEATRSVFFGGGTPSLFSAETIAALLEWLRGHGLLAADVEVTLEANPGAIERGSFAAFAEAGVNRISLGVQSFNDRSLLALGRIHSVRDIWSAVEEVQSAGFRQLNLDLMYGLPGQSQMDAVRDIEQALVAAPTHISHYQLTLEPNTLFHARPPTLPGDDAVWNAHLSGRDLLIERGFRRYEVSAYALPGAECRHNLNYWRFGDYAGVGAGAHGKRTFLSEGSIVRTRRSRHPLAYMDGSPPAVETATVGEDDRVFEFMLNTLRLCEGFEERLFEAATGLAIGTIRQRLQEAEHLGLLERTGGPGWRATELGLRFLNDLQGRFLPEND